MVSGIGSVGGREWARALEGRMTMAEPIVPASPLLSHNKLPRSSRGAGKFVVRLISNSNRLLRG